MRFIFIFLGFCCLLFSSCIDILEDIVLRKDGTGVYTYTTDLSGLHKGGMMKMFLEKQEGKDKIPDMDSLITGKELAAKDKEGNSAIWEKVTMRIESNEEKELYKITFKLAFDNVDEIAYVMKNLNKVSSSMDKPGESNNNGLSSTLGGLPVSYSLVGKSFKRVTEAMPVQEEEENMEMMKMFLDDATYKVVYHFPSKITGTTLKGAQISDNTLTKEVKILDIMGDKKPFDGTVKFK
jgi:hypothetical protein